MSDAETRLREDRSSRLAARSLFDNRLAQVKADLAARGLGQRAKASAQEKAFDALDSGLTIAKESKGIIAATAGLLVMWLFRAPLLAKARDLLGQGEVQEAADNDPVDNQQEQET